ncbi:uncharacterized protein LY79DRAFT_193558 [Colletotrichum navitas]|uniref:Uncharacterized protein n=1 Tax=Colletotrichum navitas TaxID=681940 RepID=A0AAD8PZJ1_9PEZI|nr:uncharacterized protein LY79DRAFT_193558 [Colletotrichum navitas]KAK1590871.1 hypothetical protein LY79DRAFT_193558 [Colletotrichum navitas]
MLGFLRPKAYNVGEDVRHGFQKRGTMKIDHAMPRRCARGESGKSPPIMTSLASPDTGTGTQAHILSLSLLPRPFCLSFLHIRSYNTSFRAASGSVGEAPRRLSLSIPWPQSWPRRGSTGSGRKSETCRERDALWGSRSVTNRVAWLVIDHWKEIEGRVRQDEWQAKPETPKNLLMRIPRMNGMAGETRG